MFTKVSYDTCLVWELFNTAQNVAEAVYYFLERGDKFEAQKESPNILTLAGFQKLLSQFRKTGFSATAALKNVLVPWKCIVVY